MKAKPRRGGLGRVLPGLLVSLVVLVILFVLVDRDTFLAALGRARYAYLLAAIPIYFIAYLARARAWHILLKQDPSYKRVFFTMQAGYLLNNMLPFRLGEFGRALLLGRTEGGFWRVFSTILVERAFDLILAAGLLLSTLSFVVTIPAAGQVAGMILAFMLLGFVVLHLLARGPQRAMRLFDHLGSRWPFVLRLGRDRLSAFLQGLSTLADLPGFLRVLGWMALSWGLAIAHHWLIILAFVPDAQLLWAAFALAVAALGVALPSSPGSIGVYEAAFVGALSVFGVQYESALAFALVNHGLYIGFTGILGMYGLMQEGENLGQLFRRVRERRLG